MTNNNDNNQPQSIMVDGQRLTRADLAGLIGNYFECTASDADEQLLRHALAQSPWSGSDIDEARVAMGFASVGMELERRKRLARSHRNVAWRAVAAVAALVVTAGALLYVGSADADECIAYVNGQRLTSQEQVMQMVRGNLSAMGEAHTDMNQNITMQLASVGRAVGD